MPRGLLAADERLPPLGLLVAGPGYGKSLALAELAADAARAGALVVWLRLEALDGEPAPFFAALAEAMRRPMPDFGREVAAVSAGPAPEARACWRAFWEEVAAFNVPRLVLALDDAQHLAGPDDAWPVLAGLTATFEGPRGSHAVLAATRRQPEVPLARLVARGLVRIWDAARLRFDDDEAQAYWRARAGAATALEPEILAKLEGWPLGLELWCALPAARRGNAAGAALGMLERLVAEELVETQPPARRAFMRAAALLPALTPATVAGLLGDPAAPAHLDRLAAEQLVTPSPAGDFRFPAYLQAHLQAEAQRLMPLAEQRAIAGRVAAALVAAGQQDRALPYLLAAGEARGAFAVARVALPAWLARGQRAAFAQGLDALAAQPGMPPGWLSFWRGLLASHDGDHAAARAGIEGAHAAFAAAGDKAGELKAAVRLCTIALHHHDEPAFAAWLGRAQAIAAFGRPEDQADLALARALHAEQHGDLALMRACNEAVLALPVEGNVEVATCTAIAAINLATHALYRGELAAARQHLDHAHGLAEAWGFAPISLFAGFLRADVQLTTGDLEAATAWVAGLPRHWEAALDWHDRGCGLAVLGRYMDLVDQPREADDMLHRALGIFERAGVDEGRLIVRERLATLALRRGHVARARAAIAAAGDLGGGDGGALTLALRVLGARVAHLEGRPADALAELAALRPSLVRTEAWLLLARAEIYAAAAARAVGDAVAHARAFREYEALEAAHGYRFLRGQDRALWHDVGDAPTVAEVPGPAPPPAGAAALPPSRGGDGTPLVATCLGPFEVLLDGVRLDAWPRRRAKLVLAALLLYRRGLAQHELAELIADGAPVDDLNPLQVAVKTLRRILEPGLVKGDDSRFVRWHAERYFLAAEQVGPSDVAAFEADIARGAAAQARDHDTAFAAYGDALARYHGDLFTDPYLVRAFDAEREQLRRKALGAALWRAEYAIGRGDEAGAEAAWRRATAIDATDAEAYLNLIELEAGRGHPERARQDYWAYRRVLHARLGLAPDEAFEAACRATLGAL